MGNAELAATETGIVHVPILRAARCLVAQPARA